MSPCLVVFEVLHFSSVTFFEKKNDKKEEDVTKSKTYQYFMVWIEYLEISSYDSERKLFV